MLLNGYIVFFMVTLRGAAAADTACSPPPREPEIEVQGSWDEESYRSGTVATFTCRPGYSSLGVIKKACLDGHWKPVSSGKCIYVGTCDRPPRYVDMEPQGVWDEESYPADKVATFSCRPGYTQHGVIEKSCIDGEWKPVSNGRCQLKSCGPPGDIESGSFELVAGDDYVFGAVVRYTCNKGYKMMTDDNTRQCRTNGWTDNLPKCQVYHIAGDGCGPIPREEELEVQGKWEDESYPIGTLVTFTCRPSYIQQGAIKKICAGDQWVTLLTGKCIRAGASCSAPPTIAHGDFLGSNQPHYRSGSQLEYKCPEYYTLQGNRIVKCEDGEWDEPPVCLATSCPPPPSIDNGRPVPNLKAEYASGDKVQYMCNRGYNLKKRISEAVCEETRWKSIPVCRRAGASCSAPPTIAHGDFLGSNQPHYRSGFQMEYKCPEYYTLQGNRIVKCEDGEWDEPPVCLEPCTAREKELKENNIVFRWKNADKLYSKHDESMEFLCVAGYEIADRYLLRPRCNKGVIPYPKCNKIGSCLLSEETMKNQNIYITRSSAIQDGEKVMFECNKGMIPEKTLEGTCKTRVLNYPRCITAKPCRISQEDLNANHVELISRDDEKKVFKDGEDVDVKCKAGSKSPFGGIERKGECSDGKMRNIRCFEGDFCRLNQDQIDGRNLELDLTRNSDGYYADGEDVHFVCKEGFNVKGSLDGKCENKDLTYPLCAPPEESSG
uniref:Sushi domain-containing protein n=1 Tax=Leptobrachium leishanense TaxID=445787 RepID=A0A8C5R8K0_9ANUR